MMLQASRLALDRGYRRLFSELAFTLQAGEALRVTGPNGSGKTSLLRVLCGLAQPSAGEVLWRGQALNHDREAFHRELLYVGHLSGIKDDLNPIENVQAAAAWRGRPCSEAQALSALSELGLRTRARVPSRALSQGQRRRVLLAQLALQPAAHLSILDEPFNALDQDSIALVTALLEQQLDAGGAVVYTTHQGQTLRARHTHELKLGGRA